MRRLKRIGAVLAVIFAVFPVFAQDWKLPLPQGMKADNGNILIVPESERFMNFVIFGLWPNSGQYYFLPEMKDISGLNRAKVREVEKQFYWLNYELSHGRPIRNLPDYTHLYVALPDGKFVKESRGGEKALFLQYLKERCGFTDNEIKNKVHFFKSNIQLEWAQDSCKILGREEDGRVVLGYSELDNNPYIGTVMNLAKSFPREFKLVKFDSALSAEGGDQDFIWSAPGKVSFLVGRNRVRVYLERKYNESFEDKKITREQVEEVRKAYSDAIYGVDVIFMPEKVLMDPALGSKETFHVDMISTTLPDLSGPGFRVFIPTYAKQAFDAISLQPLDPKMMKAAQNEYEQAAAQFKKMGYDVKRLEFTDHPVRNPVNIGRFRNKVTGKYTALLAKYPAYLPVDDANTPQAKLNAAFDNLNNETQNWLSSKSDSGYDSVIAAINNLWRVMDEACAAPNPTYEAQYKVFKDLGYEVVTIPVYAWGAGGLHCQMMY